jgi:hypothetical protein
MLINGAVMLQNTVINAAMLYMLIIKHKFLRINCRIIVKIEGNEVWVKLIGILMLTMRWQYMVPVELGMDRKLRFCLNWKAFRVDSNTLFRVLILAIVDYAHTLTHWKTSKTLTSKRTINYGCGLQGNRDKTELWVELRAIK